MKGLWCRLLGHHWRCCWTTWVGEKRGRWQLQCDWCGEWWLIPREEQSILDTEHHCWGEDRVARWCKGQGQR